MQTSGTEQAQYYTEFAGLNALKTQATTDRKAALEEVARQFEGLFLSQMLKSMRSANEVLSEGNYLNSQESGFYQDMFDSQLSLSMTRGEGLGLSQALVSQLSRQIPGMDEEGNALAGANRTLADYDRSIPALSPGLPEKVDEVKALAEPDRAAPERAQTNRPASTPAAQAPMPERFDSPEDFVRTLLPMARDAAEESGIDPRLMVAQAALETGWGKHMIRGNNGDHSYNLFGIKADSRWQGESVNIATTEFREGVKMQERADFRRYPDYQESFRDYVSFLQDNPRYRDVWEVADQPEAFAERLQQAGYATDPAYGRKIRSIMEGEPFEAALDRFQTLSRVSEE
ncbi:flagellar assembly peptidoglycan hydrolase FlgJ [Marinobacter zhanjiangensis]|uniref:Peptidoglycan hydrolase FlgJ n=1 Tax=Marinobacter zhanjiangensis TaxID=578215 RepID=A0ABQ3ATT1_9GAMM|nr:flagellar assembly peptidoglycan hydrolase FlgJ [Marinobacter zhanjiangensis]GGY66382.1 peptidoglycan hydrolase FlgJ [Marinobacter zhanjiangensis]